jgi:hypothetical protein
MERYKRIFEAKQVGLLYHFTSIENFYSIYKQKKNNRGTIKKKVYIR